MGEKTKEAARVDVMQVVCDKGEGLLEDVSAIPGITAPEVIVVLGFVVDLCEREIAGLKAGLLEDHFKSHIADGRLN